jgi:hypothetical protein
LPEYLRHRSYLKLGDSTSITSIKCVGLASVIFGFCPKEGLAKPIFSGVFSKVELTMQCAQNSDRQGAPLKILSALCLTETDPFLLTNFLQIGQVKMTKRGEAITSSSITNAIRTFYTYFQPPHAQC